jgi:hypothetical protein
VASYTYFNSEYGGQNVIHALLGVCETFGILIQVDLFVEAVVDGSHFFIVRNISFSQLKPFTKA